MRTSTLLTGLTLLCASCLFFCEKDQQPAAPGVNDLPGAWLEEIPATPPFVPQPIAVALTITAVDSSYELEILKDGDAVPLLLHGGSWSISGSPDTLVLSGSQCFIIDTTATPDTLMPLADEVCGMPILLPVKLTSPTTWPIKMSDLGAIVDAFPIPESVKPVLQSVVLQMEKL